MENMGKNIIVIVVSMIIGLAMIPALDVAVNDDVGYAAYTAKGTGAGTVADSTREYTAADVRMYCRDGTIPAARTHSGTNGPGLENVTPGPMFCTVNGNLILGGFLFLFPLIVMVVLIMAGLRMVGGRM